MEAQNTNSGANASPIVDEPAHNAASESGKLVGHSLSLYRQHEDLPSLSHCSLQATEKPQRSWAVERMLRRQLVAVPAPLRASTIESSTINEQPVAAHRPPPHRQLNHVDRVAQPRIGRNGALSSRADYVSASINQPLPGQSTFIMPPSTKSARMIALPITVASPPRRPLQASESTAGHRPPAREMATNNRRVNEWTSTNSTSVRDSILLKQEPGKSAAILKLVGSAAAAEKMGKSRDELVEEYKRARRAELEAMMRSMVQK
jgi:hypothetical protein